jgi:RNA-directed DNA polymerase
VIGPDLYTFEALWRHYRQCRRNKRNTLNALAFEINAEANLLALQHELRTHTYRPGRSICFLTDGPKPREVFAADFRDRVVHHLLVSHQERLFEPMFIHDSYACRTGKGTLAASDRLMSFLRQVTANGRRPAWALKLDVASFFPSIHKATLYEMLMRHIRHPELRWLTHTLVWHDPTTHYCFRSRVSGIPGPDSPHYPVPAHKSLFGKHNECGLPIGNLTSQFWGNVYLDPLDHVVKRTLKCRYYLRYVDDMVLLAPEREPLLQWCAAIAQFLRERLQLSLRPEMLAPFPVRHGIDFVGWTTWWNRRLPRRRTLRNLRTRLETFERTTVRPMWGGTARRIDLQRQDADGSTERFQATLASYAGHLRHGAARRAWDAIWAQHPWLAALFRRQDWAVRARWPRRHSALAAGLQAQYWRLVQGAGDDALVFFPCGRFIEFYGPQRVMAAAALGLRPTVLPRAGYAFTAGFPLELSGLYVSRAVRQGLLVVQLRQVPALLQHGCIPRLPETVWITTRRVLGSARQRQIAPPRRGLS